MVNMRRLALRMLFNVVFDESYVEADCFRATKVGSAHNPSLGRRVTLSCMAMQHVFSQHLPVALGNKRAQSTRDSSCERPFKASRRLE